MRPTTPCGATSTGKAVQASPPTATVMASSTPLTTTSGRATTGRFGQRQPARPRPSPSPAPLSYCLAPSPPLSGGVSVELANAIMEILKYRGAEIMKRNYRRGGFTLVELLVVIAI